MNKLTDQPIDCGKNPWIENECFDRFLSNTISEKNAKKIKDHFVKLTDDGHFSTSKMWAIKKKLNLKKKDAGTPTAKLDIAGTLITTKEGLLQLYRQTYIDRLAPKLPQEDYLSLQLAKENLFDLRYLISSAKQSEDWSQEQVMTMCKSLKNGKARDEMGLVFKLLKPHYQS